MSTHPLQQLRQELATRFPERKDVIEGALAAVLAGEHAFSSARPAPPSPPSPEPSLRRSADDGKRVRFTVGRGSPEEARRRAVEEVERHLRVAASGNDPSFAHVVAEMILLKEKSEKAPSYIRKIEEHFRLWIFPALGTSQPISAITAGDLRSLRYQLGASDLEYRSVNRILTSLRQVFKFAEHERGYCAAPSLPRNFPEGAVDDAWQVLTPDEIGRVLSAVAAEVRPLFAYIANTGLRVGSALATEVEWIDWASRIVRYPKDAMKGRRPHVVELNPEAEQALRSACTTSSSKPFDFSYWFALKRWHAARAAAGFPTLRIHDLRHSYITALLDAGVPIHVVRDIAAHRCCRSPRMRPEGPISRRLCDGVAGCTTVVATA